MAPASPFNKDEKVLCFHGDLLYEAKILDVEPVEPSDKKSPLQYRVHYKGWKNTWDDWVPQDRLRKFTDENKSLANTLVREMKEMQRSRNQGSKSAKKKNDGSTRASEERHSSVAASGQMRGFKRNLDRMEIEGIDSYMTKEQVAPIPMSDSLKSIMVDDWENVTKYMQILSLPAKVTVVMILERYEEFEKQNRLEGSPEMDILEEIVHGVRKYFDKLIARVLLYKFERGQYLELYKKMMDPVGDLAGKDASEIYGGEHLLRLFTTMPELIAATHLDEQGVSRLREELARMAQWLARSDVLPTIFINEYENVSQEYENRAKNQAAAAHR